ncbi:PaaD-like zinc ribbon domain-containing protein [Mycobacterium avium]|uniref:PaaD-like zinc ribbon domain-containing protein n=1 Tax=Mycobacterium avium TaxID=1764 RepID=UPI003BFA737B
MTAKPAATIPFSQVPRLVALAKRPTPSCIRCPMCGSGETREIAERGACSCKALYQCQTCGEPFDHHK